MAFRIRTPWLILTLLTALNLLNFLDRYVLSAVIGPVQKELDLSGFMGGLLWTIFLIGYFATSPVFGVLGDRVNPDGTGLRARLLAAGVAVWSVATVATGFATGIAMLVVARAFVGVGEASYATLAPSLIDDVAPPGRATRWMAYFSAATPVGSALGYIVGGKVLAAAGWRAAFFVAGGPGLVAALLCLFIWEPRRQAQARQALIAPARELLRIPLYRGATLGYCAYTFAIGGFAFWAPAYLNDRYGMPPGPAATKFGMMTVLGGAIGTLVGGWAADRLARSTTPANADARSIDEAVGRANVLVCAAACAIGAPLAAAAIAAPTAGTFFALVLPCQIALFAVSGPINVTLLRSAPPHLRASAMAVAIFAIHALGDMISPPLIGRLHDVAPMQAAMWAVPIVLAVAAFVWGGAVRASGWLTAGLRLR